MELNINLNTLQFEIDYLNRIGSLIGRPLRFSVTTSGTATSIGTTESTFFLVDFFVGFAFGGSLFVFSPEGIILRA
jgi:hypothetical protein